MRKLIRPVRAKLLAAKKNTGGAGEAPVEKPKDNTDPDKASSFLDADLASNLARIKGIFQNCSDIVYREFLFAQREDIRLVLIYTDGLADKHQVSEQIMRALSLEAPMAAPDADITKASAYHLIKERGLCVHQVKETDRLEDVIEAVLSGDTVLLVEGHPFAIINGMRGGEARPVSESENEMVVRGPRESFVETLRTNTALLRRKIKNSDLKLEMMQLGRLTKTDVAVVYVKGIANDKLVEEVKSRLQGIELDSVLESGYVEELIEDNTWSPFPQINHTEKPDRLAARLLEGRVGIMVDGTPIVLTVPTVFVEFLHAAEDYYERFQIATAVRIVRFLSMFLSLVMPSFYIAIITFHQEMLPTALLLSLAAQREAVPFPAFVETLLMELTFEILREAGIRLPRQVGQAVSIVGALIVGEAAVQAGLVAPATVIVVAFTGISSFVYFYSASFAIRLLRFPMIVLSATLGLYGLISVLIIIVVHLCALRSFGTPYLSPIAPMSLGDMKDLVVRAPWWAMFTRPRLIGWKNLKRQEPGQEPVPPETRTGKKGGEGNTGRG
ncbi:Spore germination protein B1 [Pelotomaculum schinkii]|uniref:Spore germination protein B1 n=1 Tax=Pelotomaculum schinkii TaxID=78350 RepID=A0A4Y7RF68_9FIRM|nr:spore germination protein [Pelotomaculum schinkii]TEB07400.1 Spore germination protein B1 [Pelotomaculum schinkii]